MIDSYLKCLNSASILQSSIPKLIDLFTMFYGEDKRDLIAEKFNNMILFGYYDISSLSSMIINIQNEKTNEIVERIFKEVGIESIKENKEKYVNVSSFEFPTLMPIMQAYEYISYVKLSPEERLQLEQKSRYETFLNFIPDLTLDSFVNGKFTKEQLSQLPPYYINRLDSFVHSYDMDEILHNKKKQYINSIHNLYPEATEDNVDFLIQSGRLDTLYRMSLLFRDGLKEYKEFSDKELKPFIELKDRLKDFERKVTKKHLKAFLLECKEYLNEEDQKKLDELIDDEYFHTSKVPGIEIMLGDYLGGVSCMEYFLSTYDDQLKNPGVLDYRKETIKKNRINYFRYKGIDLGDDYSLYENHPDALAVWPKQEDIEHVKDCSNDHLNQMNIELYTNLDIYKQIQFQVEESELLDKDSVFQPSSFTKKQTCVNLNIVDNHGEYQLHPLVMIYASGEKQEDVRLIHELNHVFELSLIDVTDHDYSCICGWDYVGGEIHQDSTTFEDTTKKDREKRNYELFSEIINELIAQKITKMMHEQGLHILTNPSYYQDYGGTSYERSIFLIRDFFEEYFDDIIASRSNNNIEIIWNKVGKENFDALNELFHEFYNNFPEFTFYQVIHDLRNNVDSEKVREYNDLKSRRDQILEKMREYSKSHPMNL